MSRLLSPDADLSPVGSLALLWPAIPQALVHTAARARLARAATRLAPIARVAIEIRLGEGEDEVDLHQYVSNSPSDAAALGRFLSRVGAPSRGGDILHRFLHAWAEDTGGLRTDLDGFFLEWDGPGEEDGKPPAIFLPIEGRHDRGDPGAGARDRALAHIARLELAAPAVVETLRRIPADVSISYVGLMLGRGGAVRVNLRGLRPRDLAATLAKLGWAGDSDGAVAWFSRLVDLTGRVAVALDFAPAIQPTIGFEASLPGFPAGEPRWEALFDWLCAHYLCTGDKRAALEGVGARLYPEDRDQDWPAAWIAAALAAPFPCAPWFERRLSHAKVSLAADGAASAKAYLSAQHHWHRGAGPAPRSGRGARGFATGGIDDAAARAAQFLVASRDQDDFWRDFSIVNGASDEWVTAFVGYALSTSGAVLPADFLAQAAAALFDRQREAGGWGYNRISPADADSTAWALKFLSRVGCSGAQIVRAEAFLRSHLCAGGGIATYSPGTSLRFRGASDGMDLSGWRSGHLCVAANAAALIGPELQAHLLSAQGHDGSWPAYWWRGDTLATALAVESLGPGARTVPHRERALGWAVDRAASARSVFDRAWLVHILADGGASERALALQLAGGLAADQRGDGGWDGDADMLFPDPADNDRRADAPVFRDEAGLFTTASALLALSKLAPSC